MIIPLKTLQIRQNEVLDNSVLSSHQRCPMKGLLQYGMNRAPVAKNFPIQFGVVYHAFREAIEDCFLAGMTDLANPAVLQKIYDTGWEAAMAAEEWEDPPVDHAKSFLDEGRLRKSCLAGFDHWLAEKLMGRYQVIATEQSFDLALPSGRRYGGRMDQIVIDHWKNKSIWIRDFKTTSRMGATYAVQFDPDNQMSGYVWAASILSGAQVEGVLIETLYNTKLKGPEIHQFVSTRTPFHIEQWLISVETDLDDYEKCYRDQTFPMRTTACNDYGGCYYRDCCGQDGWGNIEAWLLANTSESHWDFTNPRSEEGVTD